MYPGFMKALFASLFILATYTVFPQSPGGITGATVWFTANNGLNSTMVAGNQQVTSWNNLGSFSFGSPNRLVPANWNAGSVPANSQYMLVKNTSSTGFNYNPVINWNTNTANVCLGTTTVTSYIYTALPVSINQGSIFTVGNASDVLAIISTTATNSPCGAGRCRVGSHGSQMEWDMGGPNYPTTIYNNNYTTLPNIYSIEAATTSTAALSSFLSCNRSQVAFNLPTSYNLPQKYGGTNFQYVFTLGSFNGYTYGLNNNMAEVIMYNTQLTQSQSQQIESYLAIKYGITLDPAGLASTTVGYVNSAGNNIFSQGTDGINYWHQISGIGRDSVSGGGAIIQRQSHQADDSTRLYLGTLSANNIQNTSAFSNNVSYVVTGHNGGFLCGKIGTHLNERPSLLPVRMDREWKIQVTGATTATDVPEDFNMDVTLAGCAPGASINGGTGNDYLLALLVNNTGDLTTGTAIPNNTTYGTSTMSLTLDRVNGIITIHNLNAGLKTYLDPTNTLNIGLNATNTPLYFTIAAFDGTVLPLQSISFTARNNGGKTIALQWSNTNEENITNYTVQRSINKLDWNDIEEVPAFNNGTTQTYHSIDKYPVPGASGYRLKITGNDGKVQYSSIQVININDGNDFYVETAEPNPFTCDVRMNAYLPQAGSVTVRLSGTDGRFIKQLTVSGSYGKNIIRLNNLCNLSPGIYSAQISYNNKLFTNKLLKVK
jgi:hypothetical protein